MPLSKGADQVFEPALSAEEKIASQKKEMQNLEYIFQMLAELRLIAKKSNHHPLVYFIEMAALEAGDSCDKLKFEMEDAATNASE